MNFRCKGYSGTSLPVQHIPAASVLYVFLCLFLLVLMPAVAMAQSNACSWMSEKGLDPDINPETSSEQEACTEPDPACCGSVPCDQHEACGWGPHIDAPPPPVDTGTIMACVQWAKDDLIAQGWDLQSPDCGMIVRRACSCIGNGAGLLFKNWGNNYLDRSEDVIVFPSGAFADVVVSCGERNEPAWQNLCCPVDNAGDTTCNSEVPDRWRPCPNDFSPPP